MPIFKAAGKLIYYAHVPKCGGSAVETYLHERFGQVAFHNASYTKVPELRRWTKTSPQHVDVAALDLVFPRGFFDASFAIVRHPVGRIVSAYHFQLEVEKSIPATTRFGEWLEGLTHILAEHPFAYDNHTRPMAELVPPDAQIFYLEHGLDVLVPWFDGITGEKAGPRVVRYMNERSEYAKAKTEPVVPTKAEIARIAAIYTVDFRRFGYLPDRKTPAASPPALSEDVLRERDRALRKMLHPISKLKSQVRKILFRP